MKLRYIIPFVSLLFFACDKDNICTRGKGSVVKKEIFIDPVTSINASSSIDVVISQGADQKIEVEGQSNMIDLLSRQVYNGSWEISFDHCVTHNKGMTVYITVPDLNRIVVSGSGSVQSGNSLNFQDLELEMTGSGDVSMGLYLNNLNASLTGSGTARLSGQVNTQDIRVTGSGDYRAFDLVSEDTKIRLSGSGDGRIRANSTLEARISGSGDVEYKGYPTIQHYESTGSGRLENAN